MKIPNWILQIILKLTGGDTMFAKIQEAISGKKTYLVAILAIIAAAIKFSVDGNVSDFITAIFAAIGTMTMRAGISKIETPK
mgnify:CR=1 FL=1